MQDKDIIPHYKHSKIGDFMFFICAKITKFLIKHRILYYFLACTWGILMTLVGVIITIVLVIGYLFTDKMSFKKYNWVYYISIGPDYWGGFDTGLMFIRDQASTDVLNRHEWGHSFQNCLLGPFMVFLVSIPSAVRWWYRYFKYDRKGKYAPTEYSAIWFEDSADQCGNYAAQYLSNKNK